MKASIEFYYFIFITSSVSKSAPEMFSWIGIKFWRKMEFENLTLSFITSFNTDFYFIKYYFLEFNNIQTTIFKVQYKCTILQFQFTLTFLIGFMFQYGENSFRASPIEKFWESACKYDIDMCRHTIYWWSPEA